MYGTTPLLKRVTSRSFHFCDTCKNTGGLLADFAEDLAYYHLPVSTGWTLASSLEDIVPFIEFSFRCFIAHIALLYSIRVQHLFFFLE